MISVRTNIGGTAYERETFPKRKVETCKPAVEEDRIICPHCGGIVPTGGEAPLFRHEVFNDGAYTVAGRRIQPGQWRVLEALRRRFDVFCTFDYLFAALATRDDQADPKVLAVQLCHLRKALEPTPFRIEVRRGSAMWRLTWRAL